MRKKAFGLRIVTTWNNLPEVVNSTSVNTFKRRLDKHWENQDIRYNYRAERTTDTDTGRGEEQLKLAEQVRHTSNSNITESPA